MGAEILQGSELYVDSIERIEAKRRDVQRAIREVFNITIPWLDEIPAREVPCLLCGQRDLVPLNSFVLNGHRFHTVRCRVDGMMWLDPQPTEAFYERIYAEHYHRAGPDDPLLEQATLDVLSDERKLRNIARLRMDEIEWFVRPGRLLEVGYGSGQVLLEARARGWQVYGLELSRERVAAVQAQGIRAARVPLPAFAGEEESFDVVAMYSVIEHTPDPAAYLRRAAALLRPGGLLVLRLPDTGEEGPPASLIAHLYHFNRSTISELLRRCGLRVQWIGSAALWKPTRYPGTLWNVNVISRKGSGC